DAVDLGEVAAEAYEHIEGGLVLDAFGDDAQSERVTEVDGGTHQLEVASLPNPAQRGDEGAVELELVHGQAAEVCERGESCAEVVDRHVDAALLQLRDHRFAALEFIDDRGLGDLQDQRGGGQLVTRQQP